MLVTITIGEVKGSTWSQGGHQWYAIRRAGVNTVWRASHAQMERWALWVTIAYLYFQ